MGRVGTDSPLLLSPCPPGGKYKEQRLVFTACHQQLKEDFDCDVPRAQKCFRATNFPSIQGMTGAEGGVGVRREERHKTRTTLGSNSKSMPTCVTETSVHLQPTDLFSGIQTRYRVAALTMNVHFIVSPPLLF